MVHVYKGNIVSVIYKYFMICIIALSLIPLTTKNDAAFFAVTDGFCLVVFIIDYILREVALPAGIVTAEYLGSLKDNDK